MELLYLYFCMRMKIYTLLGLILLSGNVFAQSKADKKIIKKLKAEIGYLASDELEGRRTATEGEKKAAAYLVDFYKKEKIAPYEADYTIPFQFVAGKEPGKGTSLTINDQRLEINQDYFPLSFSANTESEITNDVLQDVLEHGSIWLMALYAGKDESENVHFDYEKTMSEKAEAAKKQGAKAVVFYDNYGSKYPVVYNPKSDFETASIPVLYLSHRAYKEYISDKKSGNTISLNVHIEKKELTGTNVVAYIDNKAPYTIVVGAHYDHLGYGEDGSSTYRGKDKLVHNGADDNASGTAGLMQLASKIKSKHLRNYNYLFIHFSGEELGLLGSKAIVKQMNLDSTKVAYMINMDMIGRLNDSTHALTVGGVGTSPVWSELLSKGNKEFKINVDSSGVGPSDHTSFYHQGIPVLFFFTGLHTDYHKPSDDADKVNYAGEAAVLRYVYSIIDVMDTRPKPKFTPTKQNAVKSVRFKVTLGIMPDYSYENGDGVRVDGVSEDRPAIRAGIKGGDIITQLGEHKITGMQSYMEALSKFKEGDSTKVKIMRDKKNMELPITFK